MAFGFRPVRYKDGTNYNGATTRYYVPAGVRDAFVGDPVLKTGTATIPGEGGVNEVGGVPECQAVAAGDFAAAITGVVVAIEPDRTDLEQTYVSSTNGGFVYVATNPNLVYECVADGATLTVADVGFNHGFAQAAGSTIFGTSGASLDDSSSAATITLPFKLLGLAQRVDNTFGATTSVYEVSINATTDAPNSLGV